MVPLILWINTITNFSTIVKKIHEFYKNHKYVIYMIKKVLLENLTHVVALNPCTNGGESLSEKCKFLYLLMPLYSNHFCILSLNMGLFFLLLIQNGG